MIARDIDRRSTSYVPGGVRSLVSWVVLLLLARVAPAAAGVEDSAPFPVARHSIGLSVIAHGGTVDGQNEGGVGPNLELALGDRRWQYFVELGVQIETLGPRPWATAGYQGRGGVGVRWLARSFDLEDGAFEMNLEAAAAVETFWWRNGDRLTRPELSAGFSWQIRFYGSQFTFRSSARVYFAPDRDSPMVACRGTCSAPTSGASPTGLLGIMGFAW